MEPRTEKEEQDGALLRKILGALTRAVDVDVLRTELLRCVQPPGDAGAAGGGARADAREEPMNDELLRRIVLADVLDDSILSARPGDKSFPLRLLFGALGGALADERAFGLASGLNFYFRAAMDEEVKMRLGIEVSRLYYRFAQASLTEPGVVAQCSPLLATLMNGELARVRFESVDHMALFDSSVQERDPKSNAHSGAVARPTTFLCRVVKTSVVRVRAMVVT